MAERKRPKRPKGLKRQKPFYSREPFGLGGVVSPELGGAASLGLRGCRFWPLSLRSLPSFVTHVALSLLFLGCERKLEQPPIDRREDPQYRAEMARLAEDQHDSAKRLEAVRRQIAQLQAEEARLVGEIEAKRREARQKADARRAQEKEFKQKGTD